MLFVFWVFSAQLTSVFSPSTDGAVREPDCAFRAVPRRVADGQCPHDSGGTLFLPNVCFLGWIEHCRYIT